MGSTLKQLNAAYGWPGNRRPRGEVVERLNWLDFQAWRRREEAKRQAKRHYKPDLPDGCAGCAIGRKWLWTEEVKLREAFEAGASLEQMARNHERTYGAIVARLAKLKYLTCKFIIGRGEVALLRRHTFRYRPEAQWPQPDETFAINSRGKWRAIFNG